MVAAFTPQILVLASERCAYPGADAVGKAHLEYASSVYALLVPAPVLFPEDFYLRCYSRGIDGILIASCGSDCPYRGGYTRLAQRIDHLTSVMKRDGLEIARLRLTAICTVCIKAYLKELSELQEKLLKIGPVDRHKAALLATQVRQEMLKPAVPGASAA